MSAVLFSVLFFLLALGVLVGVHELGHYAAARWAGVKVLRFSFGFGPVLGEKKIGETVFSLGLIPLGGFVRMLDEAEGVVDSSEMDRTFNRKSLLKRTVIVAAGPIINIVFAVIAYWAMLVIGVSGVSSIVGSVEDDSIAFKSGLVANDFIDSIDGHKVSTWDSVLKRSLNGVVGGRDIPFTYKDEKGGAHASFFDFSGIDVDGLEDQNLLNRLGLTFKRNVLPAVIESIVKNSAAESSGLISGDEILASNGDTINSWDEWVKIVRSSPDIDLEIDVARGSSIKKLVIRPIGVNEGSLLVGKIGAQVRVAENFEYAPMSTQYFGVLAAIPQAIERTWSMSTMTLSFIGKMLTGAISPKNLSGPVSIAQYAGQSAEMGPARFLEFLALISISLGILNLLPIPMLDGGHLLYYLIEFVSRRPVPVRVQLVGQQIGFLLLILLMGTAFYNDLVRLQ
jgi:regulator of sigma E protease